MTENVEEPSVRTSPSKLPLVVLVTIVGWFPVIDVLICSTIAQIGHCQVSEDGPRQCLLFGADLGELAYSLGVTGWFFMFTWPVAILSVVLWLLWWRSRSVSGK